MQREDGHGSTNAASRWRRTKPKLPQGWSWPVTSSEVTRLFPAARTLIWSGAFDKEWRAAPQAGYSVFLAEWNPRTVQEQPTLRVAAVRGEDRANVRSWLESGTAAEIADWLDMAARAPETWRDFGHQQIWKWRGQCSPAAAKRRRGAERRYRRADIERRAPPFCIRHYQLHSFVWNQGRTERVLYMVSPRVVCLAIVCLALLTSCESSPQAAPATGGAENGVAHRAGGTATPPAQYRTSVATGPSKFEMLAPLSSSGRRRSPATRANWREWRRLQTALSSFCGATRMRRGVAVSFCRATRMRRGVSAARVQPWQSLSPSSCRWLRLSARDRSS